MQKKQFRVVFLEYLFLKFIAKLYTLVQSTACVSKLSAKATMETLNTAKQFGLSLGHYTEPTTEFLLLYFCNAPFSHQQRSIL